MQVWTNRDIKGPVNSHEYDVHLNDDSIELYYSSEFNCAGKCACQLEDDGNGVLVKIGNKKIKLDYSEEFQLLSILLAHYEGQLEFREYKTIKKL